MATFEQEKKAEFKNEKMRKLTPEEFERFERERIAAIRQLSETALTIVIIDALDELARRVERRATGGEPAK